MCGGKRKNLKPERNIVVRIFATGEKGSTISKKKMHEDWKSFREGNKSNYEHSTGGETTKSCMD